MSDYLLIASGFVLLIAGGEFLVRGAVATALRLGMSPLLIGLTLVGFGTSAPELVTSVEAARSGSAGIALGNIVGSNIANILLILGLSAALAPIAVGARALARDAALVVASAVLFAGAAFFIPLSRPFGLGLVILLLLYLYYAYRQEAAAAPAGHTAAFDRAEAYEEIHDGSVAEEASVVAKTSNGGRLFVAITLAVLGLVAIVLGAKLLVSGASGLARAAGISEAVIGLTIVAIGTSLPELVTSVVAALRKHGDVALGNVLGSCIYNIFGIGGVTGLIAPSEFPEQIVHFDNLVMVAASILLVLFARSNYRISRLEGLALVAGYCVYIFTLWPK